MTNGLSDLENDRHQRPILDGHVGIGQSQMVCTQTHELPVTVPVKKTKTRVTVHRAADHAVDETFLQHVASTHHLGPSLTDTVHIESHGHSLPRYTKNCRYGTDYRNGKGRRIATTVYHGYKLQLGDANKAPFISEPKGRQYCSRHIGRFQINKAIAHFGVPTTRDSSLVMNEGDDAVALPWRTDGSRLQFWLLFVFRLPWQTPNGG